MSIIKDADGNDLVFWPVSGMAEGDVIGPVLITITDTPLDAEFTTRVDPRLTVLARVNGVGPYLDISLNPIDLSSLPSGGVTLQVKLQANAPINGVERVPLTVGTYSSSPAGWVL
jgi:hypothetical protein